jgi:hypothetical protein
MANFIKGFWRVKFFFNFIVDEFEHEHEPGGYGLTELLSKNLLFKELKTTIVYPNMGP